MMMISKTQIGANTQMIAIMTLTRVTYKKWVPIIALGRRQKKMTKATTKAGQATTIPMRHRGEIQRAANI